MKTLKLLLCLWALWGAGSVAGQNRPVSGEVTENGYPLAGASVSVKGANAAVVTDAEGRYSISVPEGATLVFAFVGLKTEEVPVGAQAVINVSLWPDVTQLDDVIVVAYGTAQKSTFTGSAGVLTKEKVKDVPAVSFQTALSGRIAGLDVSSRSGQAGAAPEIRIRGTGSMNASNEPLYVVDGVPVSSGSAGQVSGILYANINNIMGTLNPADIESVTVLKDAAAAALYGSRAANGVVLIQTRRGQAGKPRIDFKASFGFTPSFATDNWEAASDAENLEMYYEMFYNSVITDTAPGADRSPAAASAAALAQLNKRFNKHGYTFSAPDNTYKSFTVGGQRAGTSFDWEKELLRTAVYQSYDLSVSGATAGTNYYTSLSWTKDQGRSVLNDYGRLSARLNLSQKVGKVFELASNVSVAKSTSTGFNDSRYMDGNPFMQTRNMLWGLYWPTDPVTGEDWTVRYGSYAYNMVYYNDEWDNGSNTLRVSAIEALTAHILPGLDLKTVLSYDNAHTAEWLYYSPNHHAGARVNGSIDNYSTNVNKMVSSTTANFNRAFGKHSVLLLAGFEVEKNLTDYQRASGTDLPTTALKSVATAGKKDATGYSWGQNMASILSKADYNYDNTYYLSGSYRRDGSSKLGKDTQWGDFWSVAGSWRVQEAILRHLPGFSNLRLRASYGVNGTLPTANYGHLALVSYTKKYMSNPGGTLASIPNPELSWETSYTANLALEFGVLGNRLRGTVEYFNRNSENLLQDVPISGVTGLSTTLSNIGVINNRGVEIELHGDIYNAHGFVWSAGLTAAFAKSKITELYGGQDIIWNEPVDARARYIYREGESPLSFYGLEWAGVDSGTGKNVWFLNNDKQADLTVDGKAATYDYSQASEIIIGKVDPKVFGGIYTTFSWKGLALDMNFNYKLGGHTYDAPGRDVTDDGYYWERIRSKDEYDNRWTPENPNAKYPMMNATDMEDVNQKSSRHLHSGSFIRLKNLLVSYTLPKHIAGKIGATGVRVYFSGSNLLTAAAYGVYDPEVGADGSKGWEMPLGKTYTFGLELSF
ncbi:MAG: TonB-dependent receptor [Prevotellaceae bacterium]|jgi:TonB-linked SusC/RagA family outer membrane protein|nr:TonB-dependent receptor [Prevotellaceae bacterium]